MGSFSGVLFDGQNFQQTVELARQKALLGQNRLVDLAQNITNFRNGLTHSNSNNLLVNSEKLLRKNVTGVLNQDISYNVLLSVSDIAQQQQQLNNNTEVFANLPYKQGGLLKSGTRIQGNLYAQDMRPVGGDYNEWLKVVIPNSFGGSVIIDSKYINYDNASNSISLNNEYKIELIIVGIIVLGLLLSED